MLSKIGAAISSSVSFGALVLTNIAVAGTAALALVGKFEDTIEIRTLSCFIGIERSDCPDYTAKLDAARAEAAEALEAQSAAERATLDAEDQIAALQAIKSDAQAKLDEMARLEGRFESTMFFIEHDDPNSA